eukprot:gb/GEZN01010455.1/.p1 GENE.gb/GEZN01010455.1/~~gb/GEZN01010455.1/.p1  ORF type:complete len:364 (+),score=36.91 gb/GEZN01010455.1/:136-1227(+)
MSRADQEANRTESKKQWQEQIVTVYSEWDSRDVQLTESQRFWSSVFLTWLASIPFWWMLCFALFLFLLFTRRFAFILVLFLTYLPSYLDGSEFDVLCNRAWPSFINGHSNPLWHGLAKTFPLSIINCNSEQAMAALTQDFSNVLVAAHPYHICFLPGLYLQAVFNSIPFRFLAPTELFSFPMAREVTLWLRGLAAEKTAGQSCLKQGFPLIVPMQGLLEEKSILEFASADKISDTSNSTIDADGLIRLGLQFGSRIYPVLSMQEEDMKFETGLGNRQRGQDCAYFFPVLNKKEFLHSAIGAFRCLALLLLKSNKKKTKTTLVFGPPLLLPVSISPSKQEVAMHCARYATHVRTVRQAIQSELS